jgi:hypothetical protein
MEEKKKIVVTPTDYKVSEPDEEEEEHGGMLLTDAIVNADDDDRDTSSLHYKAMNSYLMYLRMCVILEARESRGGEARECTVCGGEDRDVCSCRFQNFNPSFSDIDKFGKRLFWKQKQMYILKNKDTSKNSKR